MEESKMHLINRLFNNETIRTIWDKEQEKYYVSVVDVVGHASPEGSDSFNQALSEKRAKTVADYLTNRGVTVNKVIGEGNVGTPKNRVVIITNGR